MNKCFNQKIVNIDLGGTLIDRKCNGPVLAMRKTFLQYGFTKITKTDIRQDMGLPKLQHIRNLFQLKQSQELKPDIMDFYKKYEENQLNVLEKNRESTKLVVGATHLIQFLRDNKIKICLTTGYNRLMLDAILKSLNSQGFVPDFDISSSEASSRQEMNEKCCLQFNTTNAIAIGDTLQDARGARTAGLGFIGISGTCCKMEEFRQVGANFIIPDISHVAKLLQDIF